MQKNFVHTTVQRSIIVQPSFVCRLMSPYKNAESLRPKPSKGLFVPKGEDKILELLSDGVDTSYSPLALKWWNKESSEAEKILRKQSPYSVSPFQSLHFSFRQCLRTKGNNKTLANFAGFDNSRVIGFSLQWMVSRAKRIILGQLVPSHGPHSTDRLRTENRSWPSERGWKINANTILSVNGLGRTAWGDFWIFICINTRPAGVLSVSRSRFWFLAPCGSSNKTSKKREYIKRQMSL